MFFVQELLTREFGWILTFDPDMFDFIYHANKMSTFKNSSWGKSQANLFSMINKEKITYGWTLQHIKLNITVWEFKNNSKFLKS